MLWHLCRFRSAGVGQSPTSGWCNSLLALLLPEGFKRRELVPRAENIVGLLIINRDIDNHPMKRPRLYAGDLKEIVDAAKEQQIGLLSTVELYKIAIAVMDGALTKEEARALLKQPGRVEFRGPERK